MHRRNNFPAGCVQTVIAASANGEPAGKALFEAIRPIGYEGSRGPVFVYYIRWREEQANGPRNTGFVTLSFALGEALQFDWSCEYAFVGGLRRRLEVVHTKLAAGRTDVLLAYCSQAHEMLLDARVLGFGALGRIPRRGIYDNMKTAVDKVWAGKQRTVNARFEAMTGYCRGVL